MKEYTYGDFKDDYIPDEDYMECEDEDSFLYALAFAFQGDVLNMRALGDVYSNSGHGVIVDYEKAAFWYGRASALGDGYSKRRLAEIKNLK